MRDQPAKLVPPSNRKAAFFFARPLAACRYDALISQCSVAVAAFFSPDPALRSAGISGSTNRNSFGNRLKGTMNRTGKRIRHYRFDPEPGREARAGKDMGVVDA
jgi:hypothetical protein